MSPRTRKVPRSKRLVVAGVLDVDEVAQDALRRIVWPFLRLRTILPYSSGEPRPKMQETEATMTTSRRSKRARVAAWRSLSISSLMSASFSM